MKLFERQSYKNHLYAYRLAMSTILMIVACWCNFAQAAVGEAETYQLKVSMPSSKYAVEVRVGDSVYRTDVDGKTYDFPAGSEVEVTALPRERYLFSHWGTSRGTELEAEEGTVKARFVLNKNRRVSAYYSSLTKHVRTSFNFYCGKLRTADSKTATASRISLWQADEYGAKASNQPIFSRSNYLEWEPGMNSYAGQMLLLECDYSKTNSRGDLIRDLGVLHGIIRMPEMPLTEAGVEDLPEWAIIRGSTWARGTDHDAIEVSPASDLRYRLYQSLMETTAASDAWERSAELTAEIFPDLPGDVLEFLHFKGASYRSSQSFKRMLEPFIFLANNTTAIGGHVDSVMEELASQRLGGEPSRYYGKIVQATFLSDEVENLLINGDFSNDTDGWTLFDNTNGNPSAISNVTHKPEGSTLHIELETSRAKADTAEVLGYFQEYPLGSHALEDLYLSVDYSKLKGYLEKHLLPNATGQAVISIQYIGHDGLALGGTMINNLTAPDFTDSVLLSTSRSQQDSINIHYIPAPATGSANLTVSLGKEAKKVKSVNLNEVASVEVGVAVTDYVGGTASYYHGVQVYFPACRQCSAEADVNALKLFAVEGDSGSVDETLPTVYLGEWAGEGVGRSGRPWSIDISLSETNTKIDFPSLSCGGTLELISQGEDFVLFQEHLNYGTSKCLTGATAKLVMKNKDELDFFEYGPAGQVAAGFVKRK